MTCLNAQQRASLIRQDVHVNRIYPIMIMCEMYIQSISKPPEYISIIDIKGDVIYKLKKKKKKNIFIYLKFSYLV